MDLPPALISLPINQGFVNAFLRFKPPHVRYRFLRLEASATVDFSIPPLKAMCMAVLLNKHKSIVVSYHLGIDEISRVDANLSQDAAHYVRLCDGIETRKRAHWTAFATMSVYRRRRTRRNTAAEMRGKQCLGCYIRDREPGGLAPSH